MTYFVTFCTFDSTVEGNPAWHGAFILSMLNKETMQLEVVDTWGFYGVPSTGDQKSRLTKFKKSLGLDLDFFGNHGWLVHEEIRFMDLGHGLHGDSYELTQEQFEQLQLLCLERVSNQEAAVRDAVGNKKLERKTEKIRHYPEEKYSKEIYKIEKISAQMEQRESRLKPFDFHLSWNGWRFSLKSSHTCKTEALDILETVLPSDKLTRYKKYTFPRFVSKGMEDIILHSEGPLEVHTKASGEKIYFRKRETTGVKLVWSLPPQNFEPLPNSKTKAFFTVDGEYCAEAKATVSKLQCLEWLLRNAVVPERYKNYQEQLVERVIACYRAFSVIEPETKTEKISGWRGFAFSLFSIPKNPEQKNLQTKINEAKFLFNSLYMAIVDGWEINDLLPSESDVLSQDNSDKEDNALEALAPYLSVNVQMKLCKIIGRNYCKFEPLADDELTVTHAHAM
jgi:hypothetical protein